MIVLFEMAKNDARCLSFPLSYSRVVKKITRPSLYLMPCVAMSVILFISLSIISYKNNKIDKIDKSIKPSKDRSLDCRSAVIAC